MNLSVRYWTRYKDEGWDQPSGWYWADETWMWHGPLVSVEEAIKEQAKYCEEVFGS